MDSFWKLSSRPSLASFGSYLPTEVVKNPSDQDIAGSEQGPPLVTSGNDRQSTMLYSR